jgi:hypothetical protein
VPAVADAGVRRINAQVPLDSMRRGVLDNAFSTIDGPVFEAEMDAVVAFALRSHWHWMGFA